jgi:hypothetical protein
MNSGQTFLQALDRLAVELDELRASAQSRLQDLSDQAAPRVQIDAAVAELRREALSLWEQRLKADDVEIAREVIARLRLDGVRSQLLKLPDETLETLLMLAYCGPSASGQELLRWLNDRLGDASLHRNAIYRLLHHARDVWRQVRRERTDPRQPETPTDAGDQARAQQDPPVCLTLDDERRAESIAGSLNLAPVRGQLEAARKLLLCRMLLDESLPSSRIRLWLQVELGRRITQNTFAAFWKQFQANHPARGGMKPIAG